MREEMDVLVGEEGHRIELLGQVARMNVDQSRFMALRGRDEGTAARADGLGWTRQAVRFLEGRLEGEVKRAVERGLARVKPEDVVRLVSPELARDVGAPTTPHLFHRTLRVFDVHSRPSPRRLLRRRG